MLGLIAKIGTPPPPPPPPAGITITIDIPATDIDSTLSSFPLCIILNNTNAPELFAAMSDASLEGINAAYKIMITEVGDVEIPVEVDFFDVANTTAVLHTLVTSVNDTVDTRLWLYFNSDMADNTTYIGATGSAVGQSIWDANYYAVFHMNQDPTGGAGSILDSTSGVHHMTPIGTFVGGDLVSTPLGNGIHHDATDYFKRATDGDNFTTDATVEVFGKSNTVGTNRTWITIANGNYQALSLGPATNPSFAGSTNGSTHNVLANWSPVLSADTYYYTAATTDTNYTAIYIDGLLDDSTAIGPVNMRNSELKLGAHYDANALYGTDGVISEARFSDIARSAPWIKATALCLAGSWLIISGPI